MNPHGTFIWNELVTTDQERCGAFYGALLGWTRKDVDMGPMGTYTLFQQDGRDVAGMMDPTTEYSRARPPHWSAYVAVDDIDACFERVAALGGEIIAAPEDIPGVGRVGMIADPTGAPLCFMTPIEEVQEP
ncbi:MAG: VOC family protein [Inquilinus sp.]|nr:VOC family protein [Inquilinus sp.]